MLTVKPFIVFLSIFAVSVSLQFATISQPVTFLLASVIPDDAFYYFEIARNIVSGHGPTFDGVNPTNGYHPLWMILILPFFKMFSVGGIYDIGPVAAVLIFSVFINALTGIVLYRIVSRYTDNVWIKTLSLFIWFFNPYTIVESLNGLETSLSIFLIATFFLSVLRFSERRTIARLAAFGAVGGLMMLARLDNVIYFAAVLLYLLVTEINREKIKRVLIAGIIASIIVAPWLVWNKAQFGMFFTSSSVTSTMVNHVLIEQDHGPGFLQKAKAVIYSTHYQYENILQQTAAPELFLLLLGALLMYLAAKYMGNLALLYRELRSRPEFYLFIGFLGIFIANASIRWVGRSWYFMAFNIFVAVLAAWFLNRVKDAIPFKRVSFVLALVLISGFYFISWEKHISGSQIAQQEMIESAFWMNENLPTGTKIGVFNAGIQGYFSSHQIVNLDGLVNNAAAEAMKERRLWQYIKNENIEYISDYDIYMSYRYKSFFGIDNVLAELTPIHNIKIADHSRSSAGITIYKVN